MDLEADHRTQSISTLAGKYFLFLHGWTARIRAPSPSVLALWIPSPSRGCCDFNPCTFIKHLSSSGYGVFFILPDGWSFLESSMLQSICECTDRALFVPSMARRKSSHPFSYHTQLTCLLNRLLLGISEVFLPPVCEGCIFSNQFQCFLVILWVEKVLSAFCTKDNSKTTTTSSEMRISMAPYHLGPFSSCSLSTLTSSCLILSMSFLKYFSCFKARYFLQHRSSWLLTTTKKPLKMNLYFKHYDYSSLLSGKIPRKAENNTSEEHNARSVCGCS